MSVELSFLVDLVAIALLGYGVYFRRHRRRDMLLSYLALNFGVLVVSVALAEANAASATGLGLGLFGVLSIVRLRSSELRHEEIAYYFVALALGLLCGIHPDPVWLTPTLAAALVSMVFVVDHPRFNQHYRHQVVTLDAAYTDEGLMRARLAELFGAEICQATVERLDLVRDTTTVDVRYRVRPAAGSASRAGSEAARQHESLVS